MKPIHYFLSLIIAFQAFAQNPKTNTLSKKDLIQQFSDAHKAPGIIVKWAGETFTSGKANREAQTPIKANDLFEIGSASKVFTAIAIMQLVESNKLALSTTLDKLFPEPSVQKLGNYQGKNYFNQVSIEMLLNHTSGFIDYLNVYDSDEKALEVYNDPDRVYSFEELIALAVEFGDANAIPGSGFQYTNTGYILLGEIISRVSGTPWKTYIKEHIINKAELSNTFFGSELSEVNKDRLIKGYYGERVTQIPYTLAGSAGEIVSTIDDLSSFLKAWKSGVFYKSKDTFSRQISTGLQDMYPGMASLKYALGVIVLDGTSGHAGQTFGFQSYMAINLNSDDTYVIAINDAGVSSIDLFMQLLYNDN